MSRTLLPAYLDGLIAAYRAGQSGRDLHLGYWDHPPDLAAPGGPGGFAEAQARLTERITGLLPMQPGQRVLDVACGFGGTLAALTARRADLTLIGVNIDRRQLELCREIAPPERGELWLVEADGCALPFVDASFDQIVCVEAIFHFRSRQLFLAEAARLLRSGGVLIISDILLRRSGAVAPWDAAKISTVLQREYGPWPELWISPETLRRYAAGARLVVRAEENWTAQTLPSYRTIAPDGRPERKRDPNAGHVLRWLHTHGWLMYQMFAFQRR